MSRDGAVAGRPWRHGRYAALFLCASLLASACATVPSSGPVHEGEPLTEVEPGAPIGLLAEPPREGEEPVEIVDGFLDASVSFDGDYQVARAHLDPRIASAWNPAAKVVVYEQAEALGESDVDGGDGARLVSLRARQVATIDERGRYTRSSPHVEVREEFRLHKVAGEWRIHDLPDGLFLTRDDIARSFRSVNLYFLDPTREVLVPDPVYLPLRRSGLATELANALLRGPTSWLGPAVRTAFPPDTGLASSEVDPDLVQGIATVDLTSQARQASPAARRDMVAQLVWTMRQLPDIHGVRVTVGAAPLEIPGKPSVQFPDAWASHDPAALSHRSTGYLVRRNQLVALKGGNLVPAQQRPGERATALRSPAVSLDGHRLAALSYSPSGDALRVGELGPQKPPAIRLRGVALTTPSWDRLGNVWTASRPPGSRTQVWAVGASGPPRRVEVALGDADVLALRVARDGTRVALVTESAGVERLWVGRVVRGSSLRIESLRDVTGPLTAVKDVAWAAPHRLAVLGSGPQGGRQVWLADIDGSHFTSRGSVRGMVSVTAAPGERGARPILVGTEQGVVYQNAGGRAWHRLSDGRDPTYPG